MHYFTCGFHRDWNFLSNRVRILKDSGRPLVSAKRFSSNLRSLWRLQWMAGIYNRRLDCLNLFIDFVCKDVKQWMWVFKSLYLFAILSHFYSASQKKHIIRISTVFVLTSLYVIKKITHSNTYMIKCIQLAITQAFTAL